MEEDLESAYEQTKRGCSYAEPLDSKQPLTFPLASGIRLRLHIRS